MPVIGLPVNCRCPRGLAATLINYYRWGGQGGGRRLEAGWGERGRRGGSLETIALRLRLLLRLLVLVQVQCRFGARLVASRVLFSSCLGKSFPSLWRLGPLPPSASSPFLCLPTLPDTVFLMGLSPSNPPFSSPPPCSPLPSYSILFHLICASSPDAASFPCSSSTTGHIAGGGGGSFWEL